MSNTAALMPVPIYPPARPRAGNVGRLLRPGQGARRLPQVTRKAPTVTPVDEDGLVYDHNGLCVDEPMVGLFVDIWV